jgi:hypothetical protein
MIYLMMSVKGEVVPMPMGEWMYKSTFFYLDTSFEVSGQLHAPAALPSEKSSRYPLYRKLGGPQKQCG